MEPSAIVFILSSEWSTYHRPGLIRAVAGAAAGRFAVLVVDNPVCLATSRWHRPERWRAWRAGGPRVRLVGENLWLLDAAIALHDRLACSFPGMRWLNRAMMTAQVRAALLGAGVATAPVTWLQFPTFQHYAGFLGEPLTVYECYDDHSDLPGLSSHERRRLVRLERRLLKRCGLVFTTSKPLFDDRRAQHPNVVLTYNAADPDFFAAVAADSLARVTQRCLDTPTIGYLGTIHEHTDLALLADIAACRPDWRIILIGPVQAGADRYQLARLQAAVNVELHGRVGDADLAPLLCRFDVGVIPYRSDARFNRSVNPNKLHEYTAMGKPVVATPGLDVSSHGDGVAVAAGLDAFLAAVQAEHAENSTTRVRRRLTVAADNSWHARAEVMLQHVERTLRERAAAGGWERREAESRQ